MLLICALSALLPLLISGAQVQQVQSEESVQSGPLDPPVASPFVYELALQSGEALIKGADPWSGANDLQRELLALRPELADDLKRIAGSVPGDLLKACASNDYEVVNKFLAENGLAIRLDKFDKSDGFGMAAVLGVATKWSAASPGTKELGKATALRYGGKDDRWKAKSFHAVSLKLGTQIVMYKMAVHEHPVVEVYTAAEHFNVYMTIWENDPSGLKAWKAARDLTPPDRTKYEGGVQTDEVVFPMVDIRLGGDIGWIKGLKSANGFKMARAKNEVVLKLNEKGLYCKEGVALGATKSLSSRYQIDRPFLFWIQVSGMKAPLFAVKIDPDVWKPPADLDKFLDAEKARQK